MSSKFQIFSIQLIYRTFFRLPVRVISVFENKWKFLRQITFPAFVIGIMSHNLHNIHTVMYIVPCLPHKVRR